MPIPLRRRRATAVAGIAVITALALAGCGRSSTPTATSAASVDDSPATGTVTVWAPDGDATKLDDVLAPFKKANPDLDVKVTLIPATDYTTKLTAAIASGSGPDIAQLYTESQSQFIDDGTSFLPVPDGLVDSSSFFPGSWSAGTVDGVAYSVPWYSYTYALVYRKDLAEKAGVSAPKTWEDTIPFFKALQSAGATKGFSADVGWDSYNGQDVAQFLWQAGGSLTNADGTEWTLDTPEMVKAITFNQSFFTEGTSDPDGPTFLDAQPYFVSSKTASLITGPWVIGQLDAVAKKTGWTAANVATATVPAGTAGSIGAVAGGSWGVVNTSKNTDAAWKTIRYLAQPDTQVAQYKAYGSLPAVETAWSDTSIASQPLLDAFLTQLKTAKNYPSASTWPQVATQLGQEMESVAKGNETPEKAAANIQSFAEGLGMGTK